MNGTAQQRHERWWACYSFRQHAVHVETEAEGLANNLHAFQSSRPVDFVPLAVFDDQKAAHEFLRKVEAMRNRREQPGGVQWS